jgi:hypothetical protein
MNPTRDRPHAIVDLLDILLRDGAVLDADVVIAVDGVPLVGIRLQAAVAGMATMTEYGMLVEWDRDHRRRHGPSDPD